MLTAKGLIIRSVLIACIAFCSISCSKLPDNVLNKKDMTTLLVDIHKGESVVELQRGYFSSDSMKKMVKQSILQKHGVSQAQLDTSFVWYGNHIEDYIEIYDEVIANLEEDLKSVKGRKGASPIFAEGDSIDIWPLSHTYKLSSQDSLQNIVFKIDKDSTWKHGDNYTLQFKLMNSRQNIPLIKAILFADYADGRVEFRPTSSVSRNWLKVRLVTDSLAKPDVVYGSISYQFEPGEVVYLDSISLVRTRNRKETYNERHGQRTYRFNKTED